MGKNAIATIYDVAGLARVSLATVSRVLNNPDKVNSETRIRVLKAIEELGYKPNPIARGLATKKSTTIAVVVSDITRASVSQMIDGILDIADDYHYSTKIFSMRNKNNFDDFVNSIVVEKVDGVILLNDELETEKLKLMQEKLENFNIPLVLSNVFSNLDYIPSVNIDFEQAGYNITKEMICSGRKDIYFFSTVRKYAANERKEAGYIRAMNEFQLEPKIFRTSGNTEINSQHINEFFNHNKVDGVISVRDSIAVSFINIAQRNGYKIPNDIAVVGMQNTKYSILSNPTLTCINVPVYEIGTEAMRLLTKFMKKEKVEKIHFILPYNIVYRNSTNYKIDL